MHTLCKAGAPTAASLQGIPQCLKTFLVQQTFDTRNQKHLLQSKLSVGRARGGVEERGERGEQRKLSACILDAQSCFTFDSCYQLDQTKWRSAFARMSRAAAAPQLLLLLLRMSCQLTVRVTRSCPRPCLLCCLALLAFHFQFVICA